MPHSPLPILSLPGLFDSNLRAELDTHLYAGPLPAPPGALLGVRVCVLYDSSDGYQEAWTPPHHLWVAGPDGPVCHDYATLQDPRRTYPGLADMLLRLQPNFAAFLALEEAASAHFWRDPSVNLSLFVSVFAQGALLSLHPDDFGMVRDILYHTLTPRPRHTDATWPALTPLLAALTTAQASAHLQVGERAALPRIAALASQILPASSQGGVAYTIVE